MLSKYLHSSLSETLKFLIVILVTTIEAIFILQHHRPIFHFLLFSSSLVLLFVLKSYFSNPSLTTYLVDFSCYKPPCFCRVPFSSFLENASRMEIFNPESLAFMSKILSSSGQSEETYLPPALHYIPPKTHQQESINEAQMILFPVIENLLSKTNLSPNDIDILIINCSGFCPSPSLSSIIINKFSMNNDIKSFNLSGMGCSASALAIDMAQQLLKIHKNSNALVLSTEILSAGWYSGHEKPKLILNCLFRMGSAAILLTNKKQSKGSSSSSSSKYKIICTVRTHRGFDDKAYNAAIREEDFNGKLGVTLNIKDSIQVAGEALRANVTILGSKLLPFIELFWYIKKYCDSHYVPNFKTVIQHFCLPVSGRQMIREIAKKLKLGEGDIEAALMTWYRFGNQSSCSLWYELAYMEAKERVKKGDRVWLIGIGTGSKCNSVVLECLKPIVGESNRGPWVDCIDEYPVMD